MALSSQTTPAEPVVSEKNPVKTFVLDTNVLIHNPDAFLSFKDNRVVIPLFVLEELDKLKSSSHEKGYNARQAIREIEKFVPTSGINEAIKIGQGITLSFGSQIAPLPSGLLPDQTDNKIIGVALSLQQQGERVFFVSKDINARVKAATLGIHVVDYEKQKVNAKTLYQGWRELPLSEAQRLQWAKSEPLSVEGKFYPNEYLTAAAAEGADAPVARYDAAVGAFLPIAPFSKPVCGIKPLNPPQAMAMDLLLDPQVQLVSLVGKAGTGKTLLAIACGLFQALEEDHYTKLLVSRPIIPMGQDIGFLPGNKKDKLVSWMQPIFDNMEVILSNFRHSEYKTIDSLINKNKLEIEALTYIRGRTLPKQYIIIDEAQNLTPHEVKTIVSRAGLGSKIVLTGDPDQIDNTYLDANSNGLSYLVDAFKGELPYGHITLAKSERSPLAELATRLL